MAGKFLFSSINFKNLLYIPSLWGIPAKSQDSKVLLVSDTEKWPKVKKASRGVDAVQLGFPRPASKRIWALFLSLAKSINLFLNSKGLIFPYIFLVLLIVDFYLSL